MKTEFNPDEWLNKAQVNSDQYPVDNPFASSPSRTLTPSPHHSLAPSFSEVDTVIARIEGAFEDITTSYADWLNLGFAFAAEFGEAGRKFYHRVSRFYNGYTRAETDKQYDRCMKSQGHGITIGTFFYLAKQAGIEVKTMARGGDGVRERWYDGVRERWYDGVMERGSEQWSVGSGDSFVPSSPLPLTPSEVDSGDSLVPSSPLPLTPSEVDSGDSLVPSLPHPLVPSEEQDPPEEEQPTLPDFIFEQLPDFFKRVVCRAYSREERDILLLGSMVTLGSALTTITGKYDETDVFTNLYLYVSARASSGKGRLILCRNLVNPIHWEKLKRTQQLNQEYEVELREFNAMKGKDMGIEKPKKPPVAMHILPANNSAAGLLQLLADNNGQGIIIETEGDTIAKAIRSEIGDFSDVMRKGFHQEAISGYRKTDHEHVEITQPCFSLVLSSTMGQLKSFIVSTENGLSSRFMFYHMNMKPVWKNVFAHSDKKSLKNHFNELGLEFYHFYSTLKERDPMEFCLTTSQQDAFNDFFARMQDKYLVLQGLDYMAIIRRLGLIAFRMMMILTAMRIPETGDFSVKQVCRDDDFESVLSIIRIMVRHASYIVSQLPEEAKTERRKNKKEQFFEGLGEKFTYKEVAVVASNMNIPERTAKRYIAVFCDKGLINKEEHGIYSKISYERRAFEISE